MPAGYTVRYESDHCCVLLPQENHYTIQVKIIKKYVLSSTLYVENLVDLKLEGRIYDITRPCIIVFPMSETGLLRDQESKFCAIWKEEKETNWSRSKERAISNETSVSCPAYHSGYFSLIHHISVKVGFQVRIKMEHKCFCDSHFVWDSVCLSVCLPSCLSACLFVCMSVCLSVYLSVYQCPSVCLCLSVCLSVSICVCPAIL